MSRSQGQGQGQDPEIRPRVAEALRSLGLEVGPALRVGTEDLVEACCLECGARVWVLNVSWPLPLPFNVCRIGPDREPYLSVHGCFDEPDDDDLDLGDFDDVGGDGTSFYGPI